MKQLYSSNDIVFFTEAQWNGPMTREYNNMRTEYAWMVGTDAYHLCLHHNIELKGKGKFKLGIVITPKEAPNVVDIPKLRKYCDKIAIMQEGPFWLYQDYPLDKQIYYFNNLTQCDIIFTHNEQDRKYYKGLTNHKDVRVLPSLMIDDGPKLGPLFDSLSDENRSGIMIGGNMVSWYGGFDSLMLAQSVTDEIYQPKMGRRQEGEEQLGLTQLPYMDWDGWIKELNKRKLGIHMMRTHAAGTFALNCSYLGIPCVGYNDLDTQRILHPNLSVDDGDLESARKIVHKLWNDLDFYKENCILTKKLYQEEYSEKVFRERFKI
jgi:hypothetical protein|tara:strand:- start:1596 stop:2555 length:960 start_codon:yes stop_codon:yes gene_type:complete